ncbi:MAG: GNAT family N-acetyltransferase [Eubacteriales bacterium]|nr:GNAT family N-acetyltransferase [Eubacteriales bacterium]
MIVELAACAADVRSQAACLLQEAFPQAYARTAREEVDKVTASPCIALGVMRGDELLGMVSARPQYGVTAWELHPLAVKVSLRGRGIGRTLVSELERRVALLGGVTLYLGCDDERGETSLGGVDLYDDLPGRIAAARAWGSHPMPFYRKLGYQIVGVLPDANGSGKPDILMAKRLDA